MPPRTPPMWVLPLLAACGGSGDFSCPLFDGVYLTAYAEISGDCGALPADLDAYDADDPSAPPPASCTVLHRDVSDDSCDVEIDVECPEDFTDGTSGTVRRVASLHKIDGEAYGTLELRLRAADGTQICRSVYSVDITKR